MKVKSPTDGKILINSKELISLSQKLLTEISNIDDVAFQTFRNLLDELAYKDGEALTAVQHVLQTNSRSNSKDTDFDFTMTVTEDLYGKIQMLCAYYNLLHEYCLDTIIAYKEIDENAANYIHSLESRIGSGE